MSLNWKNKGIWNVINQTKLPIAIFSIINNPNNYLLKKYVKKIETITYDGFASIHSSKYREKTKWTGIKLFVEIIHSAVALPFLSL